MAGLPARLLADRAVEIALTVLPRLAPAVTMTRTEALLQSAHTLLLTVPYATVTKRCTRALKLILGRSKPIRSGRVTFVVRRQSQAA